MSSITASEYFENATKGIAVPVATAHRRRTERHQRYGSEGWYVPVTSGSHVVDNGGWQFVVTYSAGSYSALDEEHDEEVYVVNKDHILAGKTVRPEEIQPHSLGQHKVHKAFGMEVPGMPRNLAGYYVEVDAKQTLFFSAPYYEATFGKKATVEDSAIVSTGAPIRYVVLPESVALDIGEAEAGMVLFWDPTNQDKNEGYRVLALIRFLADYAMLKV